MEYIKFLKRLLNHKLAAYFNEVDSLFELKNFSGEEVEIANYKLNQMLNEEMSKDLYEQTLYEVEELMLENLTEKSKVKILCVLEEVKRQCLDI